MRSAGGRFSSNFDVSRVASQRFIKLALDRAWQPFDKPPAEQNLAI
jgi:hypothetical protein